MKHCKQKMGEYYILKMDVSKYFDNIDKQILLKILKRKIKDRRCTMAIRRNNICTKRPKD